MNANFNIETVVRNMTGRLAHRGPNGMGIKDLGRVCIGHRRLSIIDLETGAQPMSNGPGNLIITFNGEIYNYRELRNELQSKQYSFRTKSDTEVILHAYEEWGEKCVEHFRGMFAFCIVDLNKHDMFFARDHFGIKPLVYYQGNDCFAFASEIQALKEVPTANLELDTEALDQFLWLQYIPAPRTAFLQIKKLPPAHRMTVSFSGKIKTYEQYWSVEFKPDERKTETEWLEELDAVLRNSVQTHLVSDVPFGAFLSGGVDSSTVVAYMSELCNKPVATFSIGFDEADCNELKYAEFVAKKWNTNHHFEIIKENILETLPDLVQHYGEPFGDSSALPTYHICKLVKDKVPMVLSGDGADEVFAGYHSYCAWMKWINGEDLSGVRKGVFAGLKKYLNVNSRKRTAGNWLKFINYIPHDIRYNLWREDYKEIVKKDLVIFDSAFDEMKYYADCHIVQRMDIKTYLPFDILTKVDVASMMNGLEVRTPFVDKDVIEFAAQIPWQYNIGKKENGDWEGKLLLKKLMRKHYPQEFLHRYKMGFSIPADKWFNKNRSVNEEIRSKLLTKNAKILDFFRESAVKSIIDEGATGRIYQLIFLEEWLQQNT